MESESLRQTDAQSAAVAIAPRVSLDDINDAIAASYHFTAAQAIGSDVPFPTNAHPDTVSFCLLVMRNGFTVIGKSAPASPANYNAELGRKYAYEDAVRQLWPLMGFALRDRLAAL